MKTRAEEIQEAAIEENHLWRGFLCDQETGDCPISPDEVFKQAFRAGARFADANPSDENWCPIELRNLNNRLEHDHIAMRIALEYYASDPLGTYAKKVLSKLKVK